MEQPHTPEEQPTPVPEPQAEHPHPPAQPPAQAETPPAEHQQAAQQPPVHQQAAQQPPVHQQAAQQPAQPQQPAQTPAPQHDQTGGGQTPVPPAAGNGQPPAQPPQSPPSEGDPKTLATLAHGLVLVAGLSNLINALSLLGFLAAIGCIVLFFVWRDREALIKDNFKQAAGFLIVTWLIGVLLTVFGGVVSASVGIFGGWRVALFLLSALRWIRIGLGAVIVIFSAMGIMEAQKSNIYKYPVIGEPVANMNL